MNKGEKGDSVLLKHLEGAGREALKLGHFEIVDQVLNQIRNLEEGSKIAKTEGLFCTECHKPTKGN
jgi:hypothetical protein